MLHLDRTIRRSARRALTALAVFTALTAGAQAQAQGDKPELVVERLPRAPTLEEFVDMRPPEELRPYLTHVDGGFVQREPVDGAPADQHTDVYLGYDDHALHVVFVAFDDTPERIRANYTSRENFFGDDLVEIQLDTFRDRRRAYSFLCNPYGVQFDAIWVEGGEFDESWDTVWESEGRRTDRGYVVRMAIPFESLRFPAAEEQVWGFLLVRDVQHNNQDTFFPAVTNRIEGRLNQAGTLRGMRNVSPPGRNIQLIPYTFVRGFEVLDEDDPANAFFRRDDFDPEIGLDGKIVIQDRLVFDFTANPDFSQVESDEPQLTVNQRFEVFFPERRPFFLENATLFSTPRNLLNTRRIQDPNVGARLTGKIGKTNLGALLIDDDGPGESLDPADPDFADAAVVSVLRFERDVGKQSKLGLLLTDRSLGDRQNRVASVDGRLRFGDHWTVVGQAAASQDQDGVAPDRSGPLYDFEVRRGDRHTDLHVHYREVDEDFEAPLGFIPRSGFREWHARNEYTYWHEGSKLLKVESALFLQRIEDRVTSDRLDELVRASVEAEFANQWQLRAFGRVGHERVDDIDFGTDAFGVTVRARPNNAIGGRVSLETNRGINFDPLDPFQDRRVDGIEANAELNLRLFHRLRIDNTILYNRLETVSSGDKLLSNAIARTRWFWSFDLKSSVRAIVEYRTVLSNPAATSVARTKRLNADLLYRWQTNPWTALYVGANVNRRNADLIDGIAGRVLIPTESIGLTDGWQVFVKYSYLFRL